MDILFRIFVIIIISTLISTISGVLTYIHFRDKQFKPQVKHIDGFTKFTIECTMKTRWVRHFLAMLRHMQMLGGIGRSREVALYSDGDGDFHPRFDWDISLTSNVEPVRDKNGDVLFDAG